MEECCFLTIVFSESSAIRKVRNGRTVESRAFGI